MKVKSQKGAGIGGVAFASGWDNPVEHQARDLQDSLSSTSLNFWTHHVHCASILLLGSLCFSRLQAISACLKESQRKNAGEPFNLCVSHSLTCWVIKTDAQWAPLSVWIWKACLSAARPAEIARKVLLKVVETRTSQSLSGFVLLLTWELCLGEAHAAAWSIKTCVSGEV